MLRSYLLAFLFVLSLFFSSAAYALPFTVVVKAGTQLPTQVQLGSTTTAYYTVFNNQASQRNHNFVKHLPPNVTQATTGTFPNTCGALFNLAAKGRPGDSCTLQLTISGPVNPNLPPDQHLFVCFPGGKTCAGTTQPLNVTQTFPVSIAITPVTASIDSQNTQQYTAIGTFADGLTINVTPLLNWASSNKAVATIASSGLATGTTGSAGGTTTITASINGVTSNPATLTVAGVLTLTATPSTFTEVGALYSQTNVGHGGFTPYTFSIASGAIPTGTTLNTATGRVSGTASAAGTFNYTIRVTDPQGKTATAATTVTIAAAVTIVGTASTFTQVGIAYSQTNVASNGITPYVYSLSAGMLPVGTALNAATGTVSGTPTGSGGFFTYTITVTDSNGRTAAATTSGTMVAQLVLTPTQSTNTEVNAVYLQTNTVSGGTAPYVYTLSAGALPTGTALGPTGNVAGTPTAPGQFSYTITVTDNIGATSSASTNVTIAAAVTIAATPSAAMGVGVPYSQANVASNGITPYLYSVSGGTLPTGTTLNTTTGTVAGTPTGIGGTFVYTIQVTDHNGQTAAVQTTAIIAAPLTLTATASTHTEVGSAYSQLNTVGGGTAPYTYTLASGGLPNGTSLSPTTGTVSGTLTVPSGTFNYTIQVTDANGLTATAPTTVTIAAAVTIVATPSTHTEVGVAYSQTNVASNGVGTYTYSISAGAIPAGTSFSTSTGTVSGTPTGLGGQFSYTVTVTDSNGQTASAPTTGTINPVLGLTATPSTNAEVGATYSQPNTVSGGLAPYTYSFTGTLPAGTSLNTATGTVSGTPTAPGGAFTYTIHVADSDGGTAAAPTTVTIAAGLALTATPSTFTEVGAVYSQVNTGSGGSTPYTYSFFGGTLPPGTSLIVTGANAGTVSGVPTTGGPYSYTIAVTDLAGITATAVTSVTITGGVTITATPSTDTVVGRAYSQTNTAGGGTAPYSFSLSAGALPAGTSLNVATGTVSGTPTGLGGPISYTIQVTDHNGATATAATSGTMAAVISLTATPSTNSGVGAPYSQLNTVGGGKGPFTYSVSVGAPPTGTSLNTATGTVSGTPTLASEAYNYTIQVIDSESFTATAQTTGTVATAVTNTATPSANAEVGLAYSQTNTAAGGIPPYTYSVPPGTVPVGTSLNTTTGIVSGTPTTSGAFSYTVTAHDSDGASAPATSTGTIASAVALSATPSTNIEVGIAYSQTNTASGGTTPYTFSVLSGGPPTGTTLNTATGTVSGTPTVPNQSFTYTIKVTDAAGATATAPTSGTVTPGVTLTATASPNTEVGANYLQANNVSGGTAPYVYSLVAGGNLPTGTTLNVATGTVSGTPTVANEAFAYSIKVVDSLTSTATAATSGTIAQAVALAATPSTNTQVGVAYSQANVASHGITPYTFSLASGGLPDGTLLSPTTGTVSGTPTIAKAYTYTIKVTDNDGITATASTTTTIAVALMRGSTSSDMDVSADESSTRRNHSAVAYTFNGTTGDTVNHMRFCLATDATCNSCSNAEDIDTSIELGKPYPISNEMLTNYLMKYTSALNSPAKPYSTYYIGVYVSSTGSNCSTPNGASAYCGTSHAGRKTQTPMCITAVSKNGATITSVSNDSSEVFLTKPAQYVYASNLTANKILQCVPNANGSFSNCASIASIISPYATAFTSVNGSQYAYVTAGDGNVYQCMLSNDGANTFTCNPLQHGGISPSSPQAIAFLTVNNNQYVYLSNASGSVYKCPVNNDGSFGACVSTTMTNGSNAIAVQAQNNKQYIYGVNSNGSIEKCTVNAPEGTLSNCSIQSGPAGTATSLAFESFNGKPLAYVTSNNLERNFVYYARLDANGNFSPWTSSNNPTGASTLIGISFATVNRTLYANVSAQDGTVYQCSINRSNGNLSACSLSSKTSATLSSSVISGYALANKS